MAAMSAKYSPLAIFFGFSTKAGVGGSRGPAPRRENSAGVVGLFHQDLFLQKVRWYALHNATIPSIFV